MSKKQVVADSSGKPTPRPTRFDFGRDQLKADVAAPLFYALTEATEDSWDDGQLSLKGAKDAKPITFPSRAAYQNNKKLWNLIMKHPRSFLKQPAHLAAFLVCLETGVAPADIIRKFIARKWLHRAGQDTHGPELTVDLENAFLSGFGAAEQPASSPSLVRDRDILEEALKRSGFDPFSVQ